MKKEEMLAAFKGIGECSTIEDARAKIVDMQKELEKDYDSHSTIVSENEQLKVDNENLRQANMKLFLQVGGKDKEKPVVPGNEPTQDLKYDALFDDKGGLK